MNVLFVNTIYSEYKIGGAEISVQALAEQFSEDNFNVGVIALGEEEKHFELNGVRIWILKIQNIYWPFNSKENSKTKKLIWHLKDVSNNSYNIKIQDIFEEFNPNVIHTNNLSGISVKIWSLAQKANIKIIHTLRDYYLLCPKTTMFKDNKCCENICLDCKLLSVFKKKSSKNIDYVIGISEYIINKHKQQGYFTKSQFKIIYNGFKINKVNKINKTYVIGNHLNIGFLGQITSSKGIELLFMSLAKLANYPNWTLHIAGNVSEKYKKMLKSLGSFEKRVIFHGYTNANLFLESIDLLVVPSLWEEPFGRVVLESIINKTAVLASKKGAIPELLVANKTFLFQPTILELKRSLESIIKNITLLNNFNFEIEEKFLLKNTMLEYKKIYKKTK